MTETKQRIERFKRPLSQDPLAILVVKSKLLTGFDAKVEQAMYLDRAISGAELLQAIARQTEPPAKPSASASLSITMASARTWQMRWHSTTTRTGKT